MILTTAIALCLAVPADSVTMNFVPSGATAKTGGYRPIQCKLSTSDSDIKKKPTGLSNPTYGKLAFGTRNFSVILDEPKEGAAKLYVDSNNDGDLTNDGTAEWAARTTNGAKMYFGNAKVDIGKEGLVTINLYRFDPDDPKRAAQKDLVLYYADYGYEIELSLDGKTHKSFIAGEPGPQTSLRVDRNGDGQYSYKRETIVVDRPFNYSGTTYVLKVKGGELALEKNSKELPVEPLPPSFGLGKKALNFTATDMTGKKVNFPGDYKGKVVMLDFWATWCGPCIAELPNVKKAYAAHHEKGFEILGISFDQKDMADKVSKFAVDNGMPWRHIYEGKYWDTDLGGLYDVSGIPFVLLVDGDTGEILAMSNTLRGPQVVDTIAKALAAKKAQ